MSRPRDMQIFWIVLFAGGFWLAIWQHEMVSKLSKSAFNAVVAVTSNLRPAPPPQPAPPVDPPPAKSKRPAPKGEPKDPE